MALEDIALSCILVHFGYNIETSGVQVMDKWICHTLFPAKWDLAKNIFSAITNAMRCTTVLKGFLSQIQKLLPVCI